MNKSNLKSTTYGRWMSLLDAARIMNTNSTALRKRFERKVRKAADGVIEVIIDGVYGRKFGGRWKVALSEYWTN